jgi:hypothetical protein
MNDFPRVNLPDVSDESRAEVQRLKEKEKEKHEFEVMRRNREGMLIAMIRKGIISKPTKKRK